MGEKGDITTCLTFFALLTVREFRGGIEVSVWESEFCHVVIREIRNGSLEEPKVYGLEVPYAPFTEITEAIQKALRQCDRLRLLFLMKQ